MMSNLDHFSLKKEPFAHFFGPKTGCLPSKGPCGSQKANIGKQKGSHSVLKGQNLFWAIQLDKKNSNLYHFSYKREPFAHSLA